jgi:predicted transcriptional regulator
MRKKSIIRIINEFPNIVKLDDFIEKLIVLEKIEDGLNDIKEGRVIDHEEVKKKIKKWSK